MPCPRPHSCSQGFACQLASSCYSAAKRKVASVPLPRHTHLSQMIGHGLLVPNFPVWPLESKVTGPRAPASPRFARTDVFGVFMSIKIYCICNVSKIKSLASRESCLPDPCSWGHEVALAVAGASPFSRKCFLSATALYPMSPAE